MYSPLRLSLACVLTINNCNNRWTFFQDSRVRVHRTFGGLLCTVSFPSHYDYYKSHHSCVAQLRQIALVQTPKNILLSL